MTDDLDDRAIATMPVPSGVVPVSALSRAVCGVTALEAFCNETIAGRRPGIPVGIPALDRATGGIQRGELWLDIGRTDSLKTMTYTSRLLWLLEHQPDLAWLVVNCEMPAAQMIERIARMHLGMTVRQLETAVKTGDEGLTALATLLTRLHFLDHGSVSLSEIGIEAEALAARVAPYRLGGIVIDHAGLIRGERGQNGGSYDRATQTAIGLKQLARQRELVVFCVVQANRGGKADEGTPVALESARDSGAFEENADFALTYSSITEARNGRLPWIKVRLSKNRRGPRVSATLGFDPRTLRMREIDEASGA